MNARDASRLYFAARSLDRRMRAIEQALGLPSPERQLFSSSNVLDTSGVRAEHPTEKVHGRHTSE